MAASEAAAPSVPPVPALCPNYAVVCSFLDRYGAQLDLPDLSYPQLERYLRDSSSVPKLLIDLHVKLLRKIGKSVTAERWEKYLVKACQELNATWAWELEQKGYREMTMECKTGILKYLCECQFDENVKFKTAINDEDPDKMRLQPIGRDKDGQMYWFQLDQENNVRMYVEEQDDLDGSSWKCVVRDRNDLAEVVALLKTQIDPELLKKEQEKENALEGDKDKSEEADVKKKEETSDEDSKDSKKTECPISPKTEPTVNATQSDSLKSEPKSSVNGIIEDKSDAENHTAIKEEPMDVTNPPSGDACLVLKEQKCEEVKKTSTEELHQNTKDEQQAKIPLKKRGMKFSEGFDKFSSVASRHPPVSNLKEFSKAEGAKTPLDVTEHVNGLLSEKESLKECKEELMAVDTNKDKKTTQGVIVVKGTTKDVKDKTESMGSERMSTSKETNKALEKSMNHSELKKMEESKAEEKVQDDQTFTGEESKKQNVNLEVYSKESKHLEKSERKPEATIGSATEKEVKTSNGGKGFEKTSVTQQTSDTKMEAKKCERQEPKSTDTLDKNHPKEEFKTSDPPIVNESHPKKEGTETTSLQSVLQKPDKALISRKTEEEKEATNKPEKVDLNKLERLDRQIPEKTTELAKQPSENPISSINCSDKVTDKASVIPDGKIKPLVMNAKKGLKGPKEDDQTDKKTDGLKTTKKAEENPNLCEEKEKILSMENLVENKSSNGDMEDKAKIEVLQGGKSKGKPTEIKNKKSNGTGETKPQSTRKDDSPKEPKPQSVGKDADSSEELKPLSTKKDHDSSEKVEALSTKKDIDSSEQPKPHSMKKDIESSEEPKAQSAKKEIDSSEEPKTQHAKKDIDSSEEPKAQSAKKEIDSSEKQKAQSAKKDIDSSEKQKAQSAKKDIDSSEEPKAQSAKKEIDSSEKQKAQSAKKDIDSSEEPKAQSAKKEIDSSEKQKAQSAKKDIDSSEEPKDQRAKKDIKSSEKPKAQFAKKDIDSSEEPKPQSTGKDQCTSEDPRPKMTKKDITSSQQPKPQSTVNVIDLSEKPKAPSKKKEIVSPEEPESQSTNKDITSSEETKTQSTGKDLDSSADKCPVKNVTDLPTVENGKEQEITNGEDIDQRSFVKAVHVRRRNRTLAHRRKAILQREEQQPNSEPETNTGMSLRRSPRISRPTAKAVDIQDRKLENVQSNPPQNKEKKKDQEDEEEEEEEEEEEDEDEEEVKAVQKKTQKKSDQEGQTKAKGRKRRKTRWSNTRSRRRKKDSEGEDTESSEEEESEESEEEEEDDDSDEDYKVVHTQKRRNRRRERRSSASSTSTDEDLPPNDDPCKHCGLPNHPELILLCDSCDNGYHTACLRPPLMIIPDGEWFCPPCQHKKLCDKLEEQLLNLDAALKKRERAAKRKERLIYVGISLENIITPSVETEETPEILIKEKKEAKKVKSWGRRSTRAKKTISYRFDEFDEAIEEAIEEDIKEAEGGGAGRGKDMANITGLRGKDMSAILQSEEGKENGPAPRQSAAPPRKKRRRLNDLDDDSTVDEEESEDEFRLSESSEEEFVVSENGSEAETDPDVNSDLGSDIGSKRRRLKARTSVVRRRSSRKRRRPKGYSDDEEEETDEEDEDEIASENSSEFSDSDLDMSRRRSRRSKKLQVNYCETSESEGSHAGANKRDKVKPRRQRQSSDSDASFSKDSEEEPRDRRISRRADSSSEDSRSRRRRLALKRRRASEEDDSDNSDDSSEEDRPVRKRVNRIDSDEEEEEEKEGKEKEEDKEKEDKEKEDKEDKGKEEDKEKKEEDKETEDKKKKDEDSKGTETTPKNGQTQDATAASTPAPTEAPKIAAKDTDAPAQEEDEDDLLGVTDLVDYVCSNEQL